jgi:uncharacterized protein YgiM (DUF1202 family)
MKKYILSLILFLCLVTHSNAQSYLGYVSKQVNFRTESNTSCKIISSLARGTALFVISKDKINGFYQVLNIETNEEGFVHSSFVQLDKMLPKNEDGIFTPVGKTSSAIPIIKIHNNTNLTLTLKLNNDLYTFSPQERKTLTLSSGSYSYRASAPGVLPDYGTENMQSNYEYEWSFYISTSRN